MQLNVAPESYASLKANRTLRCVYDAKYTPSSRHSSVAIALAHDLVKEFTDALLAHIAQADGPPPETNPTADLKLNVVTLLRGSRCVICYDMFLGDCEQEVRDRVDGSVDEPVHAVYKSGDVYHLNRNRALDRRVSQGYANLREVDLGPRPYFTDVKNPPVYDEGERVEDPEDWVEGMASRSRVEERAAMASGAE